MSDYPQSPQIQPSIMAQTSTLAIVSLIAGIAGWVLIPFIGAVTAVITGHMAKKEIRQSVGRLTGDGLATAGLVLGYIQLGLTVLAVCIIVVLALLGPAIAHIFQNIQ
jgi:hypothetical protein